jgi:hypothetical protein
MRSKSLQSLRIVMTRFFMPSRKICFIGLAACAVLIAFFQNDTSPQALNELSPTKNQAFLIERRTTSQVARDIDFSDQSSRQTQSRASTRATDPIPSDELARQNSRLHTQAEEVSLGVRKEAIEHIPKSSIHPSTIYEASHIPTPARNSLEFQNSMNEKISYTNAWHGKIANDPEIQKRLAILKAPGDHKSQTE